MLTDEMKEMFKTKRYAMVGTASKEGVPNTVAMGSPRVLDDETLGFGCGSRKARPTATSRRTRLWQ